MDAEPPKAAPSKRQRRWYQCSLRTLLVFTLIAAAGCALIRSRMVQKRREREVVEQVLKFGGSVTYDYQLANPQSTPPGPAWLRSLFGQNLFSHVARMSVHHDFYVQLVWPKSADFEVSTIKDLESLEELRLEGTNLTDRGMESIKSLSNLRELDVGDTNITDAGMASLRGLSHLIDLDLRFLRITDAGLANLEGMTALESLGLFKTPGVTDKGLMRLKNLNRLKVVDLQGTSVTSKGVRELQSALPSCNIIWNGI